MNGERICFELFKKKNTLKDQIHAGEFNVAYVSVLKYYQWDCTMFIVVDSGLIVIT